MLDDVTDELVNKLVDVLSETTSAALSWLVVLVVRVLTGGVGG